MSLKKKLTSSLSKHGKDTEVVKLMVNICSLIDEWQKEVQNFTPASQEVEQQIQTFVSKLNSVKSPVKASPTAKSPEKTTTSAGARERKGTISEKNLPSIVQGKDNKQARRNSASLPKGIKSLKDIEKSLKDIEEITKAVSPDDIIIEKKITKNIEKGLIEKDVEKNIEKNLEKNDKKPERRVGEKSHLKLDLKLDLPKAIYTESAPEINLASFLNTDRVSTKKKPRKESLPASVLILSPRRQRKKEEKSKLAASELPSPRGQDGTPIKSPRGKKNRDKLNSTLDDEKMNKKRSKASKKKKEKTEKNSENSEKLVATPVEPKVLSPVKNNPELQTPDKQIRQKSKKSRKMADLIFESANTPEKVPPISMEDLKSPIASIDGKRTQRNFGEKARTKVPKEKAKTKTSPKAKENADGTKIIVDVKSEKNKEKKSQKKDRNSEKIDKNLSEFSEKSEKNLETVAKNQEKSEKNKEKSAQKKDRNSEKIEKTLSDLSETSTTEKSTTEKSESSKRKHKRTRSKAKTKSGSNSEMNSENSEKISETSENSAKDDLSFSSGAGMVDMNELLSSLNTLEQQDPAGAPKTDFGFDLNFDIPAEKPGSNFYELDSLNSINNIENLNLLLQKTEEKSTDQATLPDFDLGGLDGLSFALPAVEDPFAGINLAAALSAPPPEPVQAAPVAAAAPPVTAAPATVPLSYDDFFAAFTGSKKVEEAPVVIERDGSLIRAFALKEDMNRKGMQRIKKKSVATGLKNKGAYQMEDTHYTAFPFNSNENIGIFAVFDGHVDKNCAERAVVVFPQVFDELLKDLPVCPDLHNLLRATFLKVDQQLMEFEMEGATATSVIVWKVGEQRYIQSANVGDSTAFLCRNGKAIALSKDHKVSSPEEQERLRSEGLKINPGQNRINGLAVSRALGDHFIKQNFIGVTAEPYISDPYLLEDTDSMMIVASDGLWDVLSGQAAFDMVKGMGDCQAMSSKLMNYVLSSGKCNDNVTIIVVLL